MRGGAGKASGSSQAPAASHDLELRKLLRRFLDVCNAIDYAHSRGILHRDIKPANIIVGKHGETLVVDWGLAKPMGSVEPAIDSVEGPHALRGQRKFGDATRHGHGDAGLHEPRTGRGDLDRLGPRATSTAWAPRSTTC